MKLTRHYLFLKWANIHTLSFEMCRKFIPAVSTTSYLRKGATALHGDSLGFPSVPAPSSW